MDVLFVEYPKCSTCKKAKRWLDDYGCTYTDRDIVVNNPTAAELRVWRKLGGLTLRELFNTSGTKYRELGVKAQLDGGMNDDDAYAMLATDGMLVKRPVLVVRYEDGTGTALFGFRENEWIEALQL